MVAAACTAESLFRSHFLPLYPPDVASDLARARQVDANPGNNPAFVQHLGDAAERFARNLRTLVEADLALDFSDASVHRLSAALTRERRDAWATEGATASPENALFNVVVHGSAYLGECVVRGHGGTWATRRPLWESLVALKSPAGEGLLPVFHWWLRVLGDEAPDRGDAAMPLTLADLYRTHVEIPCARPEQLALIAPADRTIPRLGHVRFDTLHKHLRAHLPELRELGRDFPSPERFDAYRFAWLDLLLLGGGRVLLLAGANDHGAHLFWLDREGFQKSAFFPGDKFPEPVVRLRDDKLQVIVSVYGKPELHELLWWGP